MAFFGSGLGELKLAQILAKYLQASSMDIEWNLLSPAKLQLADSDLNQRIVHLTRDRLPQLMSDLDPVVLCVLEHSYPYEMAFMIRACSGLYRMPVLHLSAMLQPDNFEEIEQLDPASFESYLRSFNAVSYTVTDRVETAESLVQIGVERARIILGQPLKWHTAMSASTRGIRKEVRERWGRFG